MGYMNGQNDPTQLPAPYQTATNNYSGPNGTPIYGNLARDASGQRAPMMDTSRGDAVSQNAGQARYFQNNAIDMLRRDANGQVPSAADAQFHQNLNQSMLANMSLANSARGGGAGMAAAQQGAQMQNAQAMGASNQQTAMMRAQEHAAAMQGYSTAAGQMRGQDLSQQGIDYGNSQFGASLQAQQNALNQQGALGYLGLGQSDINNQRGAAASKYASDTSYDAAKYGADMNFDSQVIGGVTSMAGGAMGAASDIRVKHDIAPAGGRYEHLDEVPVEHMAPGARQRMEAIYAGIGGGAFAPAGTPGAEQLHSALGAGPTSPRQREEADRAMGFGLPYEDAPGAGYGPPMGLRGGDLITSDAHAKKEAHAAGMAEGYQRGAIASHHGGLIVEGTKGEPGVAPVPGPYPPPNYLAGPARAPQPSLQQVMGPVPPPPAPPQAPQLVGAMGAGAAQGAAIGMSPQGQMLASAGNGAVSSDERGKNVGGSFGSEADAFLEHLHPYTYRYKDPSQEPSSQPTGGHYLGVMAQDVEQAPGIGRQIVKDTPRGKVLEGGALMSAMAGGLGRLNERMSMLEGRGHGR